ncbi:tetratricopeptide repeat protein [Micromonospora profundi]|uniref:Tetratricopeptide repeat protein n=1 Tax=Micromonospora profundi TaxID=1420889 RepID=A0AAJ6HXN1_9ACTN|nr:tetratricopeptide repeat protein [Micromonospora profundi]WLS48147.1 tetratricopeptide repeat protein [Micromonospora profundi]
MNLCRGEGIIEAIHRPLTGHDRTGDHIEPASRSAAADLLRRWRHRALLTQEDLAELTGLGVRTIRRLESGAEQRPRVDSLRLIADALRLTEPDRAQLIGTWGAATSPPAVVPRQLPPAVSGFCGRAAYLATLDGVGKQPEPLAVITGPAGVGKTSLAAHWAHRAASNYPDGQLYADLCGFHPHAQPAEPAAVVRRFLDALGVHHSRIPAELVAQTALFRSITAGRRMLILLDNAAAAEQVRPLLPASGTTMVVITSRSQLTGLVAAEGAHHLALDLLTPQEARSLLQRRLGADRIEAEPAAAAEIVERCGRLPLALAVAAARAVSEHGSTLSDVAQDLSDSARRLDVLDTGDSATDVRAVLSWSYHRISSPAADVFRLLGTHPAPQIGLPAAAHLAGLAVEAARRILLELKRAHLVTALSSDRYTLHDLLHLYAADLARTHDDERTRAEAMGRVIDYYLSHAMAADRALYPARDRPPATYDVPAGPPWHAEDALAWFIREHQALDALLRSAAEQGRHREACQLAWAISCYLEQRGHLKELIDGQSLALDAARHLDDDHLQAVFIRHLGRAYVLLDDRERAIALLAEAAELAHRSGDGVLAANSILPTARLVSKTDLPQAIALCRTAISRFEQEGHEVGRASALNSIGWYLTLLGRPAEAIVYCEEALVVLERHGYRNLLASTLNSLARAHLDLGNHLLAAQLYERALGLVREVGDRYMFAEILMHAGDAHLAAGDTSQAERAWRDAMHVFTELDHPDALDARNRLADLPGESRSRTTGLAEPPPGPH